MLRSTTNRPCRPDCGLRVLHALGTEDVYRQFPLFLCLIRRCPNCVLTIQVASLASLAQRLPPHSPTRVIRHRTALCAELLLPDCVRSSCCSPIALIRFKLLFLVSVRFSCCCSPLASASAALSPRFQQLPDCVRFNCCSPIASSSTAAPQLHPLRLLLPIASACSLTCSGRFQPMPNVLEYSLWSSRFSKLK